MAYKAESLLLWPHLLSPHPSPATLRLLDMLNIAHIMVVVVAAPPVSAFVIPLHFSEAAVPHSPLSIPPNFA